MFCSIVIRPYAVPSRSGVDEIGHRRPQDGGHQRERDADQHRGHPQVGIRVGEDREHREQQERAESHERGAVADAIGEQPEHRRGEDRRQEHVAVHRPGLLQRQPVRVLEVLDRERAAEREDDRVERDAEADDVPVGAVEAPEVAPDETVGRLRPMQVEAPRARSIEQIIDDRSRRRTSAKPAASHSGGCQPTS